MYQYAFEIAGLRLQVESHFALPDLFELQPYQVPHSRELPPDAVYTVEPLQEDWQISGKKILHDRQRAVYIQGDEEHRYYFWSVHSDSNYVLVRQNPADPSRCRICLPVQDIPRLMPHFRLAAFLAIERLLLYHKAFILHASVVCWQDQGILFSAPSGTGKSTQADLWNRLEGAQIVNGDRGILRYTPQGYRVYGSPYAGTSGVFTNITVPIRAIVVLSQARENSLQRLSPLVAFRKLYSESTALTWDAGFIDQLSGLLLQIVSEVPVYHLACRPDTQAVALLKQVLSEA